MMTQRERRFVSKMKVCRVATADEFGITHNVPVCHALVGGKIYFGSADDARKVNNIQKNPTATLVFDQYFDNWSRLKGLMVVCRARVLKRGKTFHRSRQALYRKYPGYAQEAALEEGEAVLVELTPGKSFNWGL